MKTEQLYRLSAEQQLLLNTISCFRYDDQLDCNLSKADMLEVDNVLKYGFYLRSDQKELMIIREKYIKFKIKIFK